MATLLCNLTVAPDFLKLANLYWGTKCDIKGTARDYEEAIFKQITSVHIVKNLHQGNLWNDVIESKNDERARTLTRVYTIKKIAYSLKNEVDFLGNVMEEFEQLNDANQLMTIMNYNKYIKYGQWITRQYASEDPDILERWGYMDMFIYEKEQKIRYEIDNALQILENDLFDNDGVTDDRKNLYIQDNKRLVKKQPSMVCGCGGRYTEHNIYKHMRTDRHIIFEGGQVLKEEKKIICGCGTTINKYHYVRHIQTISHITKMKCIREREQAKTETIELTE
jgi:hypothetical protein